MLLSPATATSLCLTHLPMTSIYTHSLLDPTLCPDASQRLETWAVCTVVGGGRASAMALAEEHKHMKLIPWAGVAGRIGLTAPGDGDRVSFFKFTQDVDFVPRSDVVVCLILHWCVSGCYVLVMYGYTDVFLCL